jgi:hypothetical protein
MPKRKRGRPRIKYDPDIHPKIAERYAMLHGATDPEIAKIIGISPRTLANWKKRYPDFLQAIKTGKDVADDRVEFGLYERAIGYEHPEDKIFNANGVPLIVPTIKHYPPEPKAAEIWLYNRRPNRWRRTEHRGLVGADGKPVDPNAAQTRIFVHLPDNGRNPEVMRPFLQPTEVQAATTEDRDNGGGEDEIDS